jgi:predicted Rossmann fold nucleotide-binding protein DprA/Smf involved in DNA uptake
MTLQSDSSRAILLLCSRLGLPSDSDLNPLTLGEWSQLADELARSPLRQPAALLRLTAVELERQLATSAMDAARLAQLLDREDLLAPELERLESLCIWVLTPADEGFPSRLSERLGPKTPPVLFGSGPLALFDRPALAVVGSRKASDEALALASEVGAACAEAGLTVVSGAARGIDQAAMHTAITAGGTSLGVLADSLERKSRAAEQRALLDEGRLLLTTPYSPSAGFSVAGAMGRNKLIYALADFALVVTSDAGKGGTWAGAVEALRAGTTPLFAVGPEGFSEGTRQLLEMNRGALAFPAGLPCPPGELHGWLKENAAAHRNDERPVQRALFG